MGKGNKTKPGESPFTDRELSVMERQSQDRRALADRGGLTAAEKRKLERNARINKRADLPTTNIPTEANKQVRKSNLSPPRRTALREKFPEINDKFKPENQKPEQIRGAKRPPPSRSNEVLRSILDNDTVDKMESNARRVEDTKNKSIAKALNKNLERRSKMRKVFGKELGDHLITQQLFDKDQRKPLASATTASDRKEQKILENANKGSHLSKQQRIEMDKKFRAKSPEQRAKDLKTFEKMVARKKLLRSLATKGGPVAGAVSTGLSVKDAVDNPKQFFDNGVGPNKFIQGITSGLRNLGNDITFGQAGNVGNAISGEDESSSILNAMPLLKRGLALRKKRFK